MFDHYNDDDVKIAPEDLSKLFDRGNPVGDDNIDLFLRQRSNGNTARARKLGAHLIEQFVRGKRHHLCGDDEDDRGQQPDPADDNYRK